MSGTEPMDSIHTALQNTANLSVSEAESQRPSDAGHSSSSGAFWGWVESSAQPATYVSDGGRRPSCGMGKGPSTSAPELAPHEPSCEATLFAVTSIPEDNSTVRARYKAQQRTCQNCTTPSSAPECRNEARILAECSRPNERSEVASLSPTARDMCGPRLEHAPDGYESGAEQEFAQYVDTIMEGLTAQSAISLPSDVASDPFLDDYKVEDVPQDQSNELLRTFIKTRSRSGLPQGLVIQSEDPEVYPHIVITPPAYTKYELYCPCGHCDYDTPSLPPQSADVLTVPPRRDEGIVKAAYPWRDGEAECQPVPREAPSECSSDDDADLFGQPCRVFSPSLFRQIVDKAAQERLVFYHVIPAMHRWGYRLAATNASAAASSFRARWDSDLFCRQIERPFEWTDPAELLLSEYSHDPNALILDSADPFIAPHIVVHEAPEQDLRTLEDIYPPAQCCYHGYYLMHPTGCSGPCCYQHTYSSPPTLELELPEPELLAFADLSTFEIEGIELIDDAESSSDTSSDSDTGSDASSDTLVTPQDDAFCAPALPLLKDTPPPPLDARFCIDEDEDELPPFDDWYQTIARRAAA